MQIKTLQQHIGENYNSVYEAAKQTGKSETQLHRWIKKGALIDSDGNVWTKPSGGKLNTNKTQISVDRTRISAIIYTYQRGR